ncbi:hypothetical protein DL93DRAFT_2234357 [Clavulina sp. PMI_390]|nr:hypothetical protein DL93DRAFT_2234357 [Clavulina sp. PMI_390]
MTPTLRNVRSRLSKLDKNRSTIQNDAGGESSNDPAQSSFAQELDVDEVLKRAILLTDSRILDLAKVLKDPLSQLQHLPKPSLLGDPRRLLKEEAKRATLIMDCIIFYVTWIGVSIRKPSGRWRYLVPEPLALAQENLLQNIEALVMRLDARPRGPKSDLREALRSFSNAHAWAIDFVNTCEDPDGWWAAPGTSAPNATVDPHETMCPLERAMVLSVPNQTKTYNLTHFMVWASDEIALSRVTADIGPMRSAHLFRSRSAPLHHEFALICFGKPGTADSWIRLERAARQKVARLVPQTDSFSPLLNGARLRESLSFGLRKEDLYDNADELAAVVAVFEPEESGGATAANHLDLSEIGSQLIASTIASPLYQLLSDNCRWFARRTVLNIAQRVNALGIVGSLHWRGRPVSLETLSDSEHILDDWFGGRQLAGNRALEIKASTLLTICSTALRESRLADAEKRGREALELMNRIPDPTPAQSKLIAQLCFRLGSALVNNLSNRAEKALLYLERARDLVDSQSPEDRPHLLDNVYASCLSKLGRHEEALRVRDAAITLFRDQIQLKGSHNILLNTLSNYLERHALHLRDLAHFETALAHSDEMINHSRRLASRRPDLYRSFLMRAFACRALILLDLKRLDDSLFATEAALEIGREIYSRLPHNKVHRDMLASLLLQKATVCFMMPGPRHSEALEATSAAADHFDFLNSVDPARYSIQCSKCFILCAIITTQLGRSPEERMVAFDRAWEVARAVPLLGSGDIDLRKARFEVLQAASFGLLSLSDPRALPRMREVLDISRNLANVSSLLADFIGRTLLLSLEVCHGIRDRNNQLTRDYYEIGHDVSEEVVLLFEKLVSDDSTPPSPEVKYFLARAHSSWSWYELALSRRANSLRGLSRALEQFTGEPFESEWNRGLLQQQLTRCDDWVVDALADESSFSDTLTLCKSLLARWEELLGLYPMLNQEPTSMRRLRRVRDSLYKLESGESAAGCRIC